LKNFIMRRTQRGGHGGAKGKLYPIARSVFNWNLRRIVYFLDGDTGVVVDKFHAAGKEIQDRERKRKRLEMEADDAVGAN
jgi:hypothetical protein